MAVGSKANVVHGTRKLILENGCSSSFHGYCSAWLHVHDSLIAIVFTGSMNESTTRRKSAARGSHVCERAHITQAGGGNLLGI
jgi:hypothetical protein